MNRESFKHVGGHIEMLGIEPYDSITTHELFRDSYVLSDACEKRPSVTKARRSSRSQHAVDESFTRRRDAR